MGSSPPPQAAPPRSWRRRPSRWTLPSWYAREAGPAPTPPARPHLASPAAAACAPTPQVWACADAAAPLFASIDRLVAGNLRRVQAAFAAARVGPHHFSGSTGYGHGDLGRAALDEVLAAVMGAEAAAARAQFVSGTHAISAGLFGCLRPGDELLAVAGAPYDTMEEVIGLRGTPGAGSLRDWGVAYRKLDLAPGGGIDWAALATAVRPGAGRGGCGEGGRGGGVLSLSAGSRELPGF